MWSGVAAKMPAYDIVVIIKYFLNVYKEKRYDPWPEDLLVKCCDLAHTELYFAVTHAELTDK